MCGICGAYEWKKRGDSAEPLVRNMAAALRHRGPDEEGFWSEGPASLGHTRLSVIDLSSGKQPMVSAKERFVISFNGEIYNFLELRADLEKKGYPFRTASDTESLLALFETKGTGAIADLRGMFAFAVYDRAERKLFLAVDSFGKKPLYYYRDDSIFLFASEPKSILTHPAVSRKIDEDALAQYLSFEYVPAPKTIFKGISKMEAGTWLSVDASGCVEINRYHAHEWSQEKNEASVWKRDFETLFLRATERRLISDVPLGVFLSGGIDSSAVLWAVKHLLPQKKIKTFTIEFDEASFDESRYARQVSDFFGAEAITEKCSSRSMLEQHETILSFLDEPLADASFIPTYFLCRLARKHVTVALSGDGGDEVFMGYPTFQARALAAKLDHWPRWTRSAMAGAARKLPVSMENLSFDFKAKQFFKGLEQPSFLRDQSWLGSFSEGETEALLTEKYRGSAHRALEPAASFRPDKKADLLQKLQDFYYHFYLQGDILVKTDRASMAHSLEVRSPMLDEDLVRRMDRMPSDLKMKNDKLKSFLKECLAGKLPQNILARPKKGFGVPIAKWISGDLKESFDKRLSVERLDGEGIFRGEAVQSLLKDHREGRSDNRKKLWTLYAFQVWKEKWL